MSRRLSVVSSALALGSILTAAFVPPASAQFYDVARSSIGFALDAIERSPRLLGMGGMSYVGDDPQTRITLWDFAASPLGIRDADSVSTLRIYPGTSSYSDLRDLDAETGTIERQDLAGRESRVGYEMWRRGTRRFAYGFTGNLGYLKVDQIAGEMTERRRTLTQPTAMPVLMGAVPFVKSERWSYAARLFYSGERSEDQYQALVQTSHGQYIDQTGTQLPPPELFTPTDYNVRSLGGGLGLGYDRGRAFKAALTVDQVQNTISGANEGKRHVSRTDEKRPYRRGQIAMVGRVGPALEWGVDGRNWSSSSEEHWYFTISAGGGVEPLMGRGKLLERDEHGRALRARVRWTRGPVELGGGVVTDYRKIDITPPLAEDLTSLNHFLNTITYRLGADSLVLPDSVSRWESEQRSWDAGGGLAVRVPGNRGLWGVEYRRHRSMTEQTTSGQGPLRRGWDLRTGLDYQCTPVMAGRVGYAYRWDDLDVLTEQNEYLGHVLTLGLGIRPAGASWILDMGYAVEWQRADFGGPMATKSCRQQLASMLRWAF